jgi:hypothetical protein
MGEHTQDSASPKGDFDPFGIARPDSALLKYYFLVSLLTGPGFPFAFVPLLFFQLSHFIF